MIVVDTNILVYFYIPGELTPLAERLLKKDAQWAAPALWRSEFRNVLALYFRQGLLTLGEAFRIQSEAEAVMSRNEYQINSFDVLRLAAESGQTAYDCEFISLAERLGVPLVTSDKKVLRAFPAIAVSLKDAAG
jgi:predicted nucleic acid-binding protein